MNDKKIIAGLVSIVGETHVLTEPNDLTHYGKDRMTQRITPNPMALVFPHSTQEVQRIVVLANTLDFKLIPSGGRSGLSGGACAINREVIVSLEKMNGILHFDPLGRLVTCQAGVITAQLQQFAENNALFFPVDLASAASSQVGGNVATNAGGNRAWRYGMIRHWVRRLTVITGKGDVLELGKGLKKNNAGYDLMQCFIGSEGTLGIITEIDFELIPKPAMESFWLCFEHFADVMAGFEFCQNAFRLQSFEYLSRASVLYSCEHNPGALSAQISAFPHHALVECSNPMADIQQGLDHWQNNHNTSEILLANSAQQAQKLKQFREGISDAVSPFMPIKFDVAVRPARLIEFVHRLERLDADYPQYQLILFGHVGDGNLHVNFLPSVKPHHDQRIRLQDQVYQLVQDMSGALSAEHGIGLAKRDLLHRYGQSQSSLYYAKEIKNVFDPNQVLNPGKIFE